MNTAIIATLLSLSLAANVAPVPAFVAPPTGTNNAAVTVTVAAAPAPAAAPAVVAAPIPVPAAPAVAIAGSCDALTTEKIKHSPTLCAGFNGDQTCMDKVFWGNIGKGCLEQLDEKALEGITEKIADQIMGTSSIDGIPAKEPLMKRLFKVTPDWNKGGEREHFLKKAAASKDHVDAIFGALTGDTDSLALFFNEKNAAFHKHGCKKFTKDLMKAVHPKFFEFMSVQCLTSIPADAFGDIDAVQLSAIKPATLEGLTPAQAKAIPKRAYGGITVEQAKVWGGAFFAPKDDKEEAEKALEAHACVVAKQIIAVVKTTVGKALAKHCSVAIENVGARINGPDLNKALLASSVFLFFMFAI